MSWTSGLTWVKTLVLGRVREFVINITVRALVHRRRFWGWCGRIIQGWTWWGSGVATYLRAPFWRVDRISYSILRSGLFNVWMTLLDVLWWWDCAEVNWKSSQPSSINETSAYRALLSKYWRRGRKPWSIRIVYTCWYANNSWYPVYDGTVSVCTYLLS